MVSRERLACVTPQEYPNTRCEDVTETEKFQNMGNRKGANTNTGRNGGSHFSWYNTMDDSSGAVALATAGLDAVIRRFGNDGEG